MQNDRPLDQVVVDSGAIEPDAMIFTPPDMGTPLGDSGSSGCGTPGKSCMGSMLQVCGANGDHTTTPCEHGCDAVRSECNTCKPNQRACAGSALVVCNGEGSGTTMMACPSGCNTTTNECNGCMPSSRWCSGNVLRECTPGGMPMDRQTCAQGCNATRLECNTCQPGTKVCNGSTLQTCRADGSGWMESPCGNGCNSTRLECNACNPSGAPTCSGNSVRTCRADGSGTTDQPCASPSCSGQTRTVPTCRSGRCDPDTESCNGYGCSGSSCRTSCPTGTVRSGGACVSCGDSGELCCANSSCTSGGCSNGHCCPSGQQWNNGASRCEAICQDITCSNGRCPRHSGSCLAIAFRPNASTTNPSDCGEPNLCTPPATARCIGDAVAAQFSQVNSNDLDVVEGLCVNRADEMLSAVCSGNSGGTALLYAITHDAGGARTDQKVASGRPCP